MNATWTWAELLSELQNLSPDQLQQTAIVYNDMDDEFHPLISGPQGTLVTLTDDTCDAFDPGQVVIMI